MFQFFKRFYNNRKPIKSNSNENGAHNATGCKKVDALYTVFNYSSNTPFENDLNVKVQTLTSVEKTRKFSIFLKHRLCNTCPEILVSIKEVKFKFE